MNSHEYYFWPRMWVLTITLITVLFCVLLIFGWKP
jgi:hypothetical protein